jgi:hypothetical protein
MAVAAAWMPMFRTLSLLLLLVAPSVGCVKKIAVNAMADALSSGSGGAFTQDDDLEFVGQALPFTLKTMETLHASAPKHDGLDLALASGFTQYAVVYLLWPAEQVKAKDLDAYEHGVDRGRNMLRRARDYGLAGLDLRHPGFGSTIVNATDTTLAATTAADVPFLYWTSASWLARISVSKEDPDAIGELPVAVAMAKRAQALDEGWSAGAIPELLIQVEPSLPLPGGPERARAQYEKALALSGGKRASVYVALAESVSIPGQNRAEFLDLLGKALAIDANADKDNQLANLYAQEQARFLLSRVDDLFVE